LKIDISSDFYLLGFVSRFGICKNIFFLFRKVFSWYYVKAALLTPQKTPTTFSKILHYPRKLWLEIIQGIFNFCYDFWLILIKNLIIKKIKTKKKSLKIIEY
jgi:hypothetical protein